MADDSVTLQDIKNKIRKYIDDRDWDQYHNAKNLAAGAVTEAAELLEIFRFSSFEQADEYFNDPIKREAISDEIIDTMWFIFRMAERHGIDISEAFEKKLKKNEEKYPIKK